MSNRNRGTSSKRAGKRPMLARDEEVEDIPEYDQRHFEYDENEMMGDDYAAHEDLGDADMPSQPQPEAQTQPSSRARKPPKPRSMVFVKHFHKIPIEGEPDRYHAICNYCGISYAFPKGGGYGTMTRHLSAHHPDKYTKEKESADGVQTQLNFSSGGEGGSSDGGVSQGQGSSGGNVLWRFNNMAYREELARFICMDHLPYSFVESLSYRNMVTRFLQPQAQHVSRQTITRDVEQLALRGKAQLIEKFKKIDHKVSICADIWSDPYQIHSYLGVTCHWIDKSWTIQKRLIAYRVFDEDDTALNIFFKLRDIVDEYGLGQKIFSFGFDNASANTASITDLKRHCQPVLRGKFFHIRCFCHILNICIQKFLSNLKENIDPIRKAVVLLASTQNGCERGKNFARRGGKRLKKFLKTL